MRRAAIASCSVALLTASAASATEPLAPSEADRAKTFAIIVASNRSADRGKMPLRYADDDAAKYHALFSMIAAPQNVTLLARMDADTEALFPHLAGVAAEPTRANVLGAAAEVGVRMRELGAKGGAAQLYFVFAGHGDVEEGRGYLELEDGRLHSDELRNVLQQVGAPRTHVILDSCNSFFVLNPRKPGGRRFATAVDAAEALGRASPGVGVFLSTSAEAQVFEWSELQSGIFSHAVRSGLFGAADANFDGQISYAELAAFVQVAARDIKNPEYRPTVFARGPGGQNDQVLLDLRPAEAAVRLDLERAGALRLAIRDRQGVRWVDLHKERDARARIRLPVAVASRARVEELRVEEKGAFVEQRFEFGPEPGERVELAELQPVAEPFASRGLGELFEQLFRAPFGPRAMLSVTAGMSDRGDAVYGISRADEARMGSMLRELAGSEVHRRSLRSQLSLVTAGLALIPAVITTGTRGALLDAVILDSVLILGPLFDGLRHLSASRSERLYESFSRDAGEADGARLVARTERELESILERDRLEGAYVTYLGTGMMVAGVGISLLAARHDDGEVRNAPIVGGAVIAFGGALVMGTEAIQDSNVERMMRLWSNDPGIQNLPRAIVVPLRGGAALALGGEF